MLHLDLPSYEFVEHVLIHCAALVRLRRSVDIQKSKQTCRLTLGPSMKQRDYFTHIISSIYTIITSIYLIFCFFIVLNQLVRSARLNMHHTCVKYITLFYPMGSEDA